MEWVLGQFDEISGWREVVCEASSGNAVPGSFYFLPCTEKLDEEVASEFLIENLREEVDIGDEGALKNDGHVGGVEKLDWV